MANPSLSQFFSRGARRAGRSMAGPSQPTQDQAGLMMDGNGNPIPQPTLPEQPAADPNRPSLSSLTDATAEPVQSTDLEHDSSFGW
jgi:hypothetical protein